MSRLGTALTWQQSTDRGTSRKNAGICGNSLLIQVAGAECRVLAYPRFIEGIRGMSVESPPSDGVTTADEWNKWLTARV